MYAQGLKVAEDQQGPIMLTGVTLQEISRITDEYVVGDLRAADRRAGHWLDEDPTLERMLAWIRIQR
jgi:flagellar hook-associated protein FlgK